MSERRKVELVKDVPLIGPKGYITKVIPAHYADTLIRHGKAKELPKPKAKPKPKAEPQAKPSKPAEIPAGADVPLTKKELKAKLKALGVEVPFAANKNKLIDLWRKALKDAG